MRFNQLDSSYNRREGTLDALLSLRRAHTHTHTQASGVTIYITPLPIKAARLEITSALYTSLTTNSRTSKWEETAPT